MIWPSVLAQPVTEEVVALPPYPWVGPAVIAAVAAAGGLALLVRRRRRQTWATLARELGLVDQTPSDLDEFDAVRVELSRHVLTLIAGIDDITQHLVGQINGDRIEVIDFEGFGVGHWAPLSIRTALANPERAARHADLTRDRPGLGELMQTVVRLRSPALQLPRFILMPENFLTRRVPEPRGVAFGDDAYPLFAHRNRLLAARPDDHDRLRKLFGRPVQMALEHNRDLTLEGDGDTLMLYRIGHRLTPHHVQQLVRDVQDLRRLLAAR